MQISHKKNTAFELAFPMVDSATPANFKTGLSPTDVGYYKDGAGAWTALAITDTATEIGTTGVYEISLTATPEMNHDWVFIKFMATGAADTLITFKMFANNIDDVQAECGLAIVDMGVAREVNSYDIYNLLTTGGVMVDNLTAAAKALIQTEAEDAIVAKHLDHLITRQGAAQAGSNNTITLDAGASAIDNYYNGQAVLSYGQARKIISYVGSTKVATVDSNWMTNPSPGGEFIILAIYILTGTGATAQQVWAYATRAITDKAGFGLADSAITTAKFAAGAINAAAVADGALDIATFAADCKTGTNLNAQVKAQDNIDFGALQKTSLNAATPASVVGAVGSVAGNVGGNVTGSVGSVASFGTLIADIWHHLLTAITTVGSVGKLIKDYLDAAISSRSTYAGGAVASVTGNVGGSVASVTGAVGSVTAGVTVTTNNDKTGYGLSVAAIQAIWDALTSALTTVGSIGKKLADWVVGTIDTYTGNTKQTGDSFARLGAPAGASVSADVVALKADTVAIKVVTDKLGTTIELDGAVYRFTTNALEMAPGGGGGGMTLDSVVEGTITVGQALSLFLSILTGKSSGGGTATITFRDTADVKNRLVVTVDTNGNRTAIVTRDGT